MNAGMAAAGSHRRFFSADVRPVLIMALVILAIGCTTKSSPAPGAPATDYLQGISSPGCLTAESIDNRIPAPQLYMSMVSCINEKKYEQATLLYSLAGTYSWFDALRVGGDEAAKAHSRLLFEALQKVDRHRQQAFWSKANAQLGNSQRRNLVCRQIEAKGMPSYSPDYLNASVTSQIEADGPLMDKATLWHKARQGYLHCKTDVLVIP